MVSKGCGNLKAYATRSSTRNGVTVETCNECSATPIGPSHDYATSKHMERITEKVTKNLTNKHVYVPPKDEGSVGGVFLKKDK
jgi:hypothetical protein